MAAPPAAMFSSMETVTSCGQGVTAESPSNESVTSASGGAMTSRALLPAPSLRRTPPACSPNMAIREWVAR